VGFSFYQLSAGMSPVVWCLDVDDVDVVVDDNDDDDDDDDDAFL
jgi:hypothetical protein